WPLDGDASGPAVGLEGGARFVESPFGKALSLDGDADGAVISRQDGMNVGAGDFTMSAWIHPKQLRKTGILSLGGDGNHGWALEMPGNKGVLRLDTSGPDNESNGSVSSPA